MWWCDSDLDSLFSYLSSHGVNAVRFWAFQSFTNDGTDFSAIDRVIHYAKQYNVRIIPVLENEWGHCPGNIQKYSDWYSHGYLEPYGEYSLSFVEYTNRIVNRYKNEPTILMWQLMNEAESETESGVEDPTSLYNFALNMSRYIHSIDNNHLVSLGTLGTGQPGTTNENYYNLHNIDTIDVVEAHDYGDEDQAWPSGRHSIASDFEVAQILRKPFFIGEAGISVSNSGYTIAERARLFDAKISTAFSNGADGYLIWIWENTPANYGEFCGGYCFTEGDPLVNVIEENSN